jgi:flagellar basal body-associated protein FliL
MIKKILLTSLIVLLSVGLLGSYFFFTGKLVAQGRQQARCRQIDVILLDSLESSIVDRQEVLAFLSKESLGQLTDSINLHALEQQILGRGEVMSAQVYTANDRTLAARITQRKPVIRFENGSQHWYADPEGYLFPVTNSVDVPMVTGIIPFHVEDSYKGFAPEKERAWVSGMVELARYIDGKPVLRREITQIDVEPDGDLVLYTRKAGPSIIFGSSADYITKFDKLYAWWRNIEPQLEQGKHYKTINLKYNQQIICRQL